MKKQNQKRPARVLWIKSPIQYFFLILLILSLGISINLKAGELPPSGNIERGEKIFKANCSGCHGIDQTLVGPALGIPNPEINKLGPEYVLKWVHSPKALIESGDVYANKIYKKYNEQIMPGFPDISPEDLHDMKSYIDQEYEKIKAKPAANISSLPVSTQNTPENPGSGTESGNMPFNLFVSGIILVCALLGLVIFILSKLIINLIKITMNNQKPLINP